MQTASPNYGSSIAQTEWPAVGDIVHYYYAPSVELGPHKPAGQSNPVAAIVVEHFGSGLVNLRLFPDGDGELLWETSVNHASAATESEGYWEWAPPGV